MPFKNEYVPTLDQAIDSTFFTAARDTLRMGHSKYDHWTIDRDLDMVLVHTGSGREPESASQEYWQFIDTKGHYDFTTEELSRLVIGIKDAEQHLERFPQNFWDFVRQNKQSLKQAEVTITYRLLHFWAGTGKSIPDQGSLSFIREALCEYGRRHIFDQEAFASCEVTLIDSRTGRKI